MSIKSNDIDTELYEILDLFYSRRKQEWDKLDMHMVCEGTFMSNCKVVINDTIKEIHALIKTTEAEARLDELEVLDKGLSAPRPIIRVKYIREYVKDRLEQLTRNKESQSSVKPEKSGSRDLVAKRSETATPKVDEALVRNYTDQKWLDETNKEVK